MTNQASVEHDYVIIGAGPAGVQLGYFLEQAGRDYVILEAERTAGAYFKTYPRHRKLLSINKVYCGYEDRERQLRWDWNSLLGPEDDINFTAYSRDYFPEAGALARYIDDYARRHKLKIRFNTRVASIVREGSEDGGAPSYLLTDTSGAEIRARRLIVASGFTKPNIPAIEGIELSEPYTTMSVEPEDYADQRVLIIGKGNSAFETAEALIPTARSIHIASPKPVEFAWRSHFVGNLRAINNNFLDTYQLKSQNAVLDAKIEQIRREGDELVARMNYIHNDEVEELAYDRVLNCAGFRFDPSIFARDCRPQLRDCGRLPLMTEAWESTNLPGVYFAGTLTQVRDYRRSSSAFIHGFRYNARALFRHLESQYEGCPWPERSISTSIGAIVDALLARINRSSALWQQFGYLCDVVRIDAFGQGAYLEEVPSDLALAAPGMRGAECFLLTLEYGERKMTDPFNQQGRVVRTDSGNAGDSAFLHPVVRHYQAGQLQAVHHVIEDLAAEWHEPEHIEPLSAFVQRQLGRAVPRFSDIRELEERTGSGLRSTGSGS